MSEVAQVPQLRFPEFSGEWEDGKLGNYGNLINGLTYSPDNIVDDGLLVLRSSNVQNGQIYLNDNVYVNLDVDDAALTKEDDILICVRNGSKRLIGKSTIINKNLPKSTHGAFMTVFRGESNKFISHWFHSSIYYKEVHKNLGATINSINGSNLKKFKTIFPLKPEQQKIAAFLTAVDTKIEQLSKKQELLGEYKKGLMQQIFSQVIRFKADDGCDFPDWEEKKLGGIGSFYRGHTYNSTNVKNNGLLVLRSSNIKNDKLVLDKDLQFVDKICSDKISLRTDDIVICMANGSKHLVGKSGVYYGDYDNKLTVGAFCSIFRTDNKLSKYILQTVQYKRYLHILLAGTNINNLKNSELAELKFNLPVSINEQTKIANFLSSIDSKIEQVSKQLVESKQFKKALLQQMFV
jgi:type I restriction enzyme S subunit